ncbi:hypothetical protein BJ742DRAFT_741818 [Cladochytrium replicatum]|nr:hypothetical protein BJ742DRAFT_741818 [Cladochytrium replicatum]
MSLSTLMMSKSGATLLLVSPRKLPTEYSWIATKAKTAARLLHVPILAKTGIGSFVNGERLYSDFSNFCVNPDFECLLRFIPISYMNIAKASAGFRNWVMDPLKAAPVAQQPTLDAFKQPVARIICKLGGRAGKPQVSVLRLA